MNAKPEQGIAEVHDMQQERIDRAAADWFIRRSDDDHAQDNDEFYRWLASDIRHGIAFDEIAAAYEDIGMIEVLHDQSAQTHRGWISRHWKGASGLAAASIAGLAVLFAQLQPEATVFATRTGEVRVIALGDGSKLTLGPRSRLVADISGGTRSVSLEEGNVFFDVAHDQSRPFLIEAGGAEINVVGTKFEVSKRESATTVNVEQGRVELKDRYALSLSVPHRLLQAGQSGSVNSKGRYLALQPEAPAMKQVGPGDVAAWRRGHLVYEDRALVDVAADLNRYYAPGVIVLSGAPQQMRVTASFKSSDIPNFLAALSETLPVMVERQSNGGYVIGPRR